jgi:hypothetical protein
MQKLSSDIPPSTSRIHHFLRKRDKNFTQKNLGRNFLVGAWFSFWIIYFALFWTKALFFNEVGGLVAGHVNIWGDWAAHFTMGTAMAERGFLLKSSPFLWGAKFSYPFIANLISAVLLRLTNDLILSFVLPSFFLSIFFIWSLYYFFLQLWKSSQKALLSSTIFLFNGGVGFYFFITEIITAKNPLHIFLNPPHEFTRLDAQSIKWINVIDSMVIPQRAFLLGFPLTLLALSLIYKNFYLTKKAKLWQIIFAGLILGVMPLIHTHSFLAAFIILAFWMAGSVLGKEILDKKHLRAQLSAFRDATDRSKGAKRSKSRKFNRLKDVKWSKRAGSWLTLILTTSIIALPIIKLFFWNQIGSNFFKFYPGWLAKEFEINWFVFWFKNWFLVPPLAILGFLVASLKNKKNFFIFGPFIFIFILANLFLFQPFIWDNTKLIIWSSVGFSYLIVYILEIILKKKSFFKFKFTETLRLKKMILSIIFLSLISSGAIDVYRIIRHDLHSYTIYSHEELELTDWVKNNTSPTSTWLTGEKHNHFLFNLTGRQSLLTYRGWLWTHGYKYFPIEKDVKQMFAHPLDSQKLFEKYSVDYIVVGHNEKKVWQANKIEFENNFPLIKETKNYKIFRAEGHFGENW